MWLNPNVSINKVTNAYNNIVYNISIKNRPIQVNEFGGHQNHRNVTFFMIITIISTPFISEVNDRL